MSTVRLTAAQAMVRYLASQLVDAGVGVAGERCRQARIRALGDRVAGDDLR